MPTPALEGLTISSVASCLNEDGSLVVDAAQVTIDDTTLDYKLTTITDNTSAAQAAAEAAQAAAVAAQSTADDAASAAATAASDAASAQSAADAAAVTASTAASNAAAAQSTADSAATAAATAQATADAAASDLTQAQADLQTAQDNYAALAAQANATDEELAAAQDAIAAAQTAVDTAQATADAASTAASAAQSAADAAATAAATAQADADSAATAAATAQTTADAAQSAADTAQAAAEAAQSTADDAAAAAAELETRTTTLETELSVVQGQITAKVWQTDIDTAVDTLNGSITTLNDQYAQMVLDLNSVTLSVGDLTTTVTAQGTSIDTITGELALKVDKDDNDQVVSMLNASADVITLTSNRLVIESDNFTLTAEGEVTCASGTIGGWYLGATRIQSSTTIDIGSAESGMLLVNEDDQPYIHVQDDTGHCTFQVTRTGDVRLDSTIYMYDPNYDYWMETYGSSPAYPQYTKALYYTYQEAEYDEDGELLSDPYYLLTIGQTNDFVYIPGGFQTENGCTTGDLTVTGDIYIKNTYLTDYTIKLPAMQHGNVTVSVTASTVTTFSVTFDAPFAANPDVVLTPRHKSSVSNLACKVMTVSTTGFTGYIYSSGGGTHVIHWIAMYGD